MKSTVYCIHWTLLIVFIISCSCLLALVVSCEGTSKSIDGPITGITAPIHPPSALPKTTHQVLPSNSPDLLDEKTSDEQKVFVNISSSEIKSEVESTVSSSENERGGNLVFSDAVRIQPELIKNDPVAEIHSSFEESLIETKSCDEISQSPDEVLKSKSDCTEQLNSKSGAGSLKKEQGRVLLSGRLDLSRKLSPLAREFIRPGPKRLQNTVNDSPVEIILRRSRLGRTRAGEVGVIAGCLM
ncbi:hypothetical protein J437_LFUL000228 [Ladona fulva]|uniref:Uncharacterized protein n=1 Tax=Ladona fulva TaxID=123851 RepID=A0A8K0NV26_LADFU|nr:hypothetical protein J437_LFUL000228 [Ladona fulva]